MLWSSIRPCPLFYASHGTSRVPNNASKETSEIPPKRHKRDHERRRKDFQLTFQDNYQHSAHGFRDYQQQQTRRTRRERMKRRAQQIKFPWPTAKLLVKAPVLPLLLLPFSLLCHMHSRARGDESSHSAVLHIHPSGSDSSPDDDL